MSIARGTPLGDGIIAAIARLAIVKQLREDMDAGRIAIAINVPSRAVMIVDTATGVQWRVEGVQAEDVL